MGEFKKNFSSSAIRWVKLENLHITLQFLPTVQASDIEILSQEAEKELLNFASFPLELEKIELFPPENQPHLISFQVKASQQLSLLSSKLGHACIRAGYPIEQRPFRAHLTLGHLKSSEQIILPDVFLDSSIVFKVNEVGLYESHPLAERSTYIIQKRFQLNHMD